MMDVVAVIDIVEAGGAFYAVCRNCNVRLGPHSSTSDADRAADRHADIHADRGDLR